MNTIEQRSSTMDDSSSSKFYDSKSFRDEPSSDLRLQASNSSSELSDGSNSRSDDEAIELAYTRKGRLPHFLESKWQKYPSGRAAKNWCCLADCNSVVPASWEIRRRRVCLYSSIVTLVVILIVAITVPVTKNKKNKTESSVSYQGEGGKKNNDDGNNTPRPPSSPTNTADTPDIASYSDVVYMGMPDSPFSILDPVVDLDLYPFDRPVESSPSPRLDPLRANTNNGALPTNSWYQNLLRLGADEIPGRDHKAYTIPYVIDTAGAIPGVRIHNSRLISTSTQVTLTIDEPFGLTLGGMAPTGATTTNSTGYTVHHATDLGITLQWDAFDNTMSSTLVQGMPYVTMIYDTTSSSTESVLPTIYSELDVEEVIVDDVTMFDCYEDSEFRVEQELQLKFLGSGQRWLIFFSRPVEMQCQRGSPTILQVIGDGLTRSASATPLIVRAALVVSSSDTSVDSEAFEGDYMALLRAHSDIFPGEATRVSFSFNSDQAEPDRARIQFDWDARSMQNGGGAGVVEESIDDMIMFALPHHQDLFAAASISVLSDMCTTSMSGPVCLTKGTIWNLDEELPPVDLRAPRHPDPAYISDLAGALMEDITYQIPENFQIGAADTYFSAKTIAKLGRILLINEEVRELCPTDGSAPTAGDAYIAACEGLVLPSNDDVNSALDQLRQTMTTWIKDNQQAPFVYDPAWGGVVSCGCLYDSGVCTNQFPDCPSFTDPGLNFGNGFYNDHHFHYGYVLFRYLEEKNTSLDRAEHFDLSVTSYANIFVPLSFIFLAF
jgi:endoglucanase Acf2